MISKRNPVSGLYFIEKLYKLSISERREQMVNHNEKQNMLFLYRTWDDVSLLRSITSPFIGNNMENRWLIRAFVRRRHTGVYCLQHTGRISDGKKHGTAKILLGLIDGGTLFWYTFISRCLAGRHKADGKHANYQRRYDLRHIRYAGRNAGTRQEIIKNRKPAHEAAFQNFHSKVIDM